MSSRRPQMARCGLQCALGGITSRVEALSLAELGRTEVMFSSDGLARQLARSGSGSGSDSGFGFGFGFGCSLLT
ncbi:conserved hypothetical protein [Luteimonas sp. 9C]|nr:conserved hypothetical protein [Luteimonas sp. 9C]